MKELVVLYMEFWSQFKYKDLRPPYTQKELPAFQEGIVEERIGDAMGMPDFPYLVYPVLKPDFTESAFGFVHIWDRPPDGMTAVNFQDRLLYIIEQIEEQITAGGILLPAGKSSVGIRRGNPWINIIHGDPSDPKITRAIINVVVDNYTM